MLIYLSIKLKMSFYRTVTEKHQIFIFVTKINIPNTKIIFNMVYTPHGGHCGKKDTLSLLWSPATSVILFNIFGGKYTYLLIKAYIYIYIVNIVLKI